MKDVEWVGTSRDDLRSFPDDPRGDLGHQLHRVQLGLMPQDFKPMPDVGIGCIEVRVKDDGNIYRVFYVAKFDDTIYVLHSFVKKTQKTSKGDIATGKARYSLARNLANSKKKGES